MKTQTSNHLPANNRDYTNNPITEQEMRSTYIAAFGKEYDSPERKQFPLPIEIAYLVAVQVLQDKQDKQEKEQMEDFTQTYKQYFKQS